MPGPLRQDVRNRIVQAYISEANRNKGTVFKMFKGEKISRSTIYNLLKHYDEHNNVNVDTGYGKGARKLSVKVVERVRKLVDKVPDSTVRAAAAQLKIPKSTVAEIKLKDLGLKAYTKKSVPKYKK